MYTTNKIETNKLNIVAYILKTIVICQYYSHINIDQNLRLKLKENKVKYLIQRL